MFISYAFRSNMCHCDPNKVIISCARILSKPYGTLGVLPSAEETVIELFEQELRPANRTGYIPSAKYQKETRKQKERDLSEALIQCKRSEFNHYKNTRYDKLKPMPLASKGWGHYKSKGDYFKIFLDKEVKQDIFSSDCEWQDLGLDDELIKVLQAAGFSGPKNIQALGIPTVLKGYNTLLAAETGCGKTHSFLVPLLQQILRWRPLTQERPPNSPLALVLTPCRELTNQIGEAAEMLCQNLNVSTTTLIGGGTKKRIMNPSYHHCDIVVATLGVMSKMTTTGIYNMSHVRHVVLDEADTLLDDSFNEHLVYFLKKKFQLRYAKPANEGLLPNGTQLTLVSATMPTSLSEILDGVIPVDSLKKVTTGNLHNVMPHVPQLFLRLGRSQKPGKLLELAKESISKGKPLIIFSNKTSTCCWVTLMLAENGVDSVQLNGDMTHAVRAGKFDQFQRGEVNIISSTDIGSRGLDTIRAKHIINYDFPLYMSDYVHRCGRTGRIGSPENCLITNFISGDRELELVERIEVSVRTMSSLPNVNANISKIIKHRIIRNVERETGHIIEA